MQRGGDLLKEDFQARLIAVANGQPQGGFGGEGTRGHELAGV